MANDAESAIYNRLTTAPVFKPSGVKLFVLDWTLDPGDVVTVKSDGVSYPVPIYSMNLEWKKASKLNIQSTGSQKREPLSPLRRREYRSGRGAYRQQMAEEELSQQYQHYVTENEVYKESVYKIMGVKFDENMKPIYQIVYETDPETGEIIIDPDTGKPIPVIDPETGEPMIAKDAAGNPIPVYDETSDGSISGQIIQSAQSLETLYEKTGIDSLGQNQTLYSRITQTADRINTIVARTGISETGDYVSLQSQISQEANKIGLFVELKNNQYVIKRAGIIAAINEDSTSTTTISADKIALDGTVIAGYLEGGSLDVNSITAQEVWATELIFDEGGETGTETAFYETTLGNKTNPQKIKFLGVNGEFTQATTITYADFPHTHSVTVNDQTGGVTLGGAVQEGDSTANFNIANTVFYQNHVGIRSVDPGGWLYDSTEHKYYNPVVATAKDSTQANPDTVTANVFIPDISLTPVLGLTDVGTVKAWGPSVSGTVYSAAADLSLYLKEKDNYVYLTKTNSDPVSVGPDSNVVARKEIQGGTVTSGTITDILTRGNKVTYNSTSEMIQVLLQVTGTDISNAPFDDYVELSVSASAIALSKGNLTNTSTDSFDNVYAGRYYISRSSGGLFKVENVNTITASVSSLAINLELAVPTSTLTTSGLTNWDSTDHVYKYDLTASLSVDSTGNTLKRQVKELTLNPTDAINYGKTLVTIDTITLGTITANSSARTATVRTTVTLDNGETKTADVDVSTIYQAGLDGGPAISSAPFIARLVDTDNVFIKNRQKTVNVSAIYQKGVDDATPSYSQYVYTTSQAPFVKTIGETIASNVKWGDLLVDTEVEYISTYVAYQKVGIGSTTIAVTYYYVEYDGYLGYIRESYCGQKHSPAQGDHGGWVSEPVKTIISVDVDVLQHIGYSGDVYIYLDPQKGPMDQYLSEFSSNPMTVTDNDTGKYLELINGYYANHPVGVYSGTLTHRARLKVEYNTGTEYVVVEFTSNAVAPYQTGWEVVSAYNYYERTIPVSFTDTNGRSLTLTCQQGFSDLVVDQSESVSSYISSDVTYEYNSAYSSTMTCRFVVRKYYSDNTHVDVVVQKMAKMEPKPVPTISSVTITGVVHQAQYFNGRFPITIQPVYPNSSGTYPQSANSSVPTNYSTYGSNADRKNEDMSTYFEKVYSSYYAINSTQSEMGPSDTECQHKMVVRVLMSDGTSYTSLLTFKSRYR